ncbi:hypothetical protein KAR91_65475 [Candidatus Pacearchaeota archaeon]|nr:hypothetical protein [Candidatus Pacearchaeota archaeon]
MLPVTMLIGPGIPEEAFAFELTNFFNQKPDGPETVPVKVVDMERSRATIDFLQELSTKQDELLVSIIKIIDGIEVGQGEGGSPAWDTVKQSISKDYENTVLFCHAALNKIMTDYPVEEKNGSSDTDDPESN